MSEPTGEAAIRIERLGKSYRLGLHQRGYDTLRETLVETAKWPLRKAFRRGQARPENTLWALRDISLTIRPGEMVGLIGHNGAGKTTLLKILSRITEPTSGWAEVKGRVGSLLEVGTGFHPELTGRENVFLNGAILGMRRAEIRRRFDEIVSFADIERFLDTPVKRYSSGMQVRLAFAVAAHLDPDILLVDEVLAVGDADFQRKSLGKMGEVAAEGRTVVFVSHNLALIQALCRRGVVIEKGRTVADASVTEAIDQYLRSLERAASQSLFDREDRDSRGWDQLRVTGVEIHDAAAGHQDVVVAGRPATIVVHLSQVLPTLQCRLTIVNNLGQPVATLDSEVNAPSDVRDGELGPRVECDISALPLLPGRYRIDVLISARRQIQDGLQGAAFFDVEPGLISERPVPATGWDGNLALPHKWHLPS